MEKTVAETTLQAPGTVIVHPFPRPPKLLEDLQVCDEVAEWLR